MAAEPISFPLDRIKTVVVMVQENRSFDHMLGWMKSINPEIDGVTGQESNPLSTTDPSSGEVHFGDNSDYVVPDPDHGIAAIYEQLYGTPFVDNNSTPISPTTPPTMNGFAQAAKTSGGENADEVVEAVMNGFRPDKVPVYRELVKEFAVCDRWFASVPASTQPNRMYVHAATSHGATGNDTKKLVKGFPQKTIFESLDEAGYDFGIYYQDPPATLFYRNLRKLKYIGKFHQFDVHFKNHCKEGKLPNYVVVEQRYFDLKLIPANDDHPSHDVYSGQKFVKDVYESLRSSPQWNEMLFIIIYDEHGGFYDHVPPPTSGVPSPDDIVGPDPYNFKFDRLGLRVPAIFISPWIQKGTVLHKPSGPYESSQFEHSSIAATVKKIFSLKEFLTKRDAWAGTFESVLTRATPREDCPTTLPEPVRMRTTDAADHLQVTELQQELVQMGAALNGDHTKEIYPDKLVENMTVAEGARYLNDAFNRFLDECEKCKKNGVDESTIVSVECKKEPQEKKKKTLVSKIVSCLACKHS